MRYILATVDTGNFEWAALGRTEAECRVALVRAYDAHAEDDGLADPGYMLELVATGDVNYVEIEVGVALRDGSPVPPA